MRRRTKKSRTRVLLAERLEERTVFSASYASALSIGGVGQDGVYDIEADAAGYSYVAGEFSGTVDFDLSLTHAGDSDILSARGSRDAFIAKYAPDDSLVWVRRMGGDAIGSSYTDVARSIALDSLGNVYVGGEFLATADFGPTSLTAAAGTDVFVAKFNSSGSLGWVKQVANASRSNGIGVDAQGNVYAMALRDSTGSIGFDVLKFTATGATAWTRSLFTNSSYSGDLAVSASGNTYLVGEFSGTVDFDPGSKVKSVSVGQQSAAFVLNLDTSGKFGWVSPFTGSGQVAASDVTLDGSGNVIVGGGYMGTIDFNPSRTTTTLDTVGGAYIAKLNSTGGLVWAKALTDPGSASGTSTFGLDTDSAGNIYATGVFHSTIDLNPGAGVVALSSAGSSDIFVVKLSSGGSYEWGETIGGTGLDVAWAIAVDGTGGTHIAGYFYGEVDFDPDPIGTSLLTSPGYGRNGFRLRLNHI